MKASEYGSRADKTRIEVCDLLEELRSQLIQMSITIYDLKNTLWNEEYENDEEESVKRGRWIYWDGWCSNHDMRIEDAVCSECGYKHPTVHYERGDAIGRKEAYEAVLNKLADECPVCGAVMEKE